MSDLAFNLLGNMAYSYGRNPDVVGIKDGQPVNAEGKVVPFMKQPNLIGRMFNPLASRAMELNSQVENAPLLARQQEDIADSNQRWTLGKHIDTVPQNSWPTIHDFAVPSDGSYGPTNPSVAIPKAREEYITELQNPQTAPIERVEQIKASAGMPWAASTGQLLGKSGNVNAQSGLINANVDQTLSNNRSANINSIIRASNQTLSNQILSGDLTGQELADAIKLHPELAEIAKQKAERDKVIATAQASPANLNHTVATIGNQAQADENTSALSSAMSGQNVHDIPIITGTLANQNVAQNAESQWISPTDILGRHVTPEGVGQNQIRPGYINPSFAKINGMAKGSNPSDMSIATGANGNKYVLPQADSKALTQPTTGSAYNESVNDIKSAHHDAVDADIKAQKAALDAAAKQNKLHSLIGVHNPSDYNMQSYFDSVKGVNVQSLIDQQIQAEKQKELEEYKKKYKVNSPQLIGRTY